MWYYQILNCACVPILSSKSPAMLRCIDYTFGLYDEEQKDLITTTGDRHAHSQGW